jgi:hypothetical protein
MSLDRDFDRMYRIIDNIEALVKERGQLRTKVKGLGLKVPRDPQSPKSGSKVIPEDLRAEIGAFTKAYHQGLGEDDRAFWGMETLCDNLNDIILALEWDIRQLNGVIRGDVQQKARAAAERQRQQQARTWDTSDSVKDPDEGVPAYLVRYYDRDEGTRVVECHVKVPNPAHSKYREMMREPRNKFWDDVFDP